MKKFTFTLVLGILLLNVSAFGRMSELNIRLYNNAGFNIVLDNQIINNNSSNYDFLNLSAGNHYLKVVVVPIIRGNRGNYNGNPRLLFSGNINIGANRKVFAMIDAYNRFLVIREEIFRDEYYNKPDPRNERRGNNDYDRNDKRYGNDKRYDNDRRYDNDYGNKRNNNDYGYNKGNNSNYGYNSHNNNNNYGYNNYGYNNYSAMLPGDFNNLKNTIANATFESTKLGIAKSAASMNRFTSDQVLNLLYMFTYESTKLEFAKLAYNSTIDKAQFYIVNNAFTYSSSIDDLNRYISRY